MCFLGTWESRRLDRSKNIRVSVLWSLQLLLLFLFSKVVVERLLQQSELVSTPDIVKQRAVFRDVQFWYPFERSNDLVQFQVTGDVLLTSSIPLPPVTTAQTDTLELPTLGPVHPLISLNEDNIYEIKNLYRKSPFSKYKSRAQSLDFILAIQHNVAKRHPHTAFFHNKVLEVKNLYGESVTENQTQGRSLLKTFTVASSYARQQYGVRNNPTIFRKTYFTFFFVLRTMLVFSRLRLQFNVFIPTDDCFISESYS